MDAVSQHYIALKQLLPISDTNIKEPPKNPSPPRSILEASEANPSPARLLLISMFKAEIVICISMIS